MRRRALAWGAAALGLYVAIAATMAGLGIPVVPVFDGVGPPPPYRWVDPPSELETTNQPALPGELEIPLEPREAGNTAFTQDSQALVSVPTSSIAPREGERAVRIRLTPVDPQTIGPPPPRFRYEGNAYRIEAIYRPSDAPAELVAPVTVIMRYPVHATRLFRRTGSRWVPIPTQGSAPVLQLFSDTRELGTFVAAAPRTGRARGWFRAWMAYAGAGLALAVAGVAAFLIRRRSPGGKARRGRARPGRGAPGRKKPSRREEKRRS